MPPHDLMWRPLWHNAVINYSPEIVQLLLNRDGVDPNASFNDKTSLHHAMGADHEDLLKLLLIDQRVDANRTGLANGRTPLHDAMILDT